MTAAASIVLPSYSKSSAWALDQTARSSQACCKMRPRHAPRPSSGDGPDRSRLAAHPPRPPDGIGLVLGPVLPAVKRLDTDTLVILWSSAGHQLQHFQSTRHAKTGKQRHVVPEPITMGTSTKASENERVTWTSGCTKVSWGSIRMIVPDVELDCGKGVIVRYTDIGPRRAEPVFLFHG